MPRVRQIARYASETEEIQRGVLRHLVSQAAQTEWGKAHGYDNIKSYEDFAAQVPVSTYEETKGYIDRMRHGEKDVLWKGSVKWYAKSSGTTNDKSKFIPVSAEGLKRIHYAGGRDAVALYLRNNPESRIFDGRTLILGGSHAPNCNLPGSLVGDLSAILIENINPLVNMIRVPKKQTALLSDFMTKRDLIAREAINKNVSNISGVPSWMLSVLDRVLEISGKSHINEVWPNLEVFFHGGVAFTPYRERYKQIITSSKMHYMETYNASEGFFAFQNDFADHSMLLILDGKIFYEFEPLGGGRPLAAWEVEQGKTYELMISSSNGLWRYRLGDTVTVTCTSPLKIRIAGRTRSFINAFGEEVMEDNANRAIEAACDATGASIANYTAGPFYAHDNRRGHHQWLIEWIERPQSMAAFADVLDKTLQSVNSDYQAKRAHGIFLDPPEIITAQTGLFDRWLASAGNRKLGGQRKIPRLNNNRALLDQLLSINE